MGAISGERAVVCTDWGTLPLLGATKFTPATRPVAARATADILDIDMIE